MSVRLSQEEAWKVLDSSHTGIFTTLRADGSPVTLPVWFAVVDGAICMRTPPQTKKVKRIKRDPRASFLVESGEKWAELQAVHLSGTVELVEDEASMQRIADAMDEKYASYRTARTEMPTSAQAAYAQFAYLRFSPAERMLTWDNRRLQP